MIETNDILRSIVCTPLSYLYGGGVFVRNKLFDSGILKSYRFKIPVISVGNIAVGGTGKTPHIEYLIELLRTEYTVAVLSRGYKRKTKGFILANEYTSPADIGDEPYQIYRKYGSSIYVSVCESRVEGIRKLKAHYPEISVILLDDAFQHRYVEPALSIVLTEFSRPFYNDRFLPLGNLRDSVHSVRARADAVIVTKCPETIKPVDFRLFKKYLNLFPYQKLFFSKIVYGSPKPVFGSNINCMPSFDLMTVQDMVLLVTGIANPRPLTGYLKKFGMYLRIMPYADHHNFTRSDFEDIQEVFSQLKGSRKYILTTEKDAVRMMVNPYFPEKLKDRIFYLPVRTMFLPYDQKETFDQWIASRIRQFIVDKSKGRIDDSV